MCHWSCPLNRHIKVERNPYRCLCYNIKPLRSVVVVIVVSIGQCVFIHTLENDWKSGGGVCGVDCARELFPNHWRLFLYGWRYHNTANNIHHPAHIVALKRKHSLFNACGCCHFVHGDKPISHKHVQTHAQFVAILPSCETDSLGKKAFFSFFWTNVSASFRVYEFSSTRAWVINRRIFETFI